MFKSTELQIMQVQILTSQLCICGQLTLNLPKLVYASVGPMSHAYWKIESIPVKHLK